MEVLILNTNIFLSGMMGKFHAHSAKMAFDIRTSNGHVSLSHFLLQQNLSGVTRADLKHPLYRSSQIFTLVLASGSSVIIPVKYTHPKRRKGTKK